MILFSLMMVSMLFIMLSRATASYNRIKEVLETEVDLTNIPEAIASGETSGAGHKIRGLVEFEHVKFHYNDNGEEVLEDDYIFGAICNSTSVGGVMTLDPGQVDLQDGKFEVLLVRAPKTLQEISECLLAVQKQQYNNAMMTFRSASHITVEADPDMPWTLDGEKEEGHKQVEVQNLHHAIKILKKEEQPDV